MQILGVTTKTYVPRIHIHGVSLYTASFGKTYTVTLLISMLLYRPLAPPLVLFIFCDTHVVEGEAVSARMMVEMALEMVEVLLHTYRRGAACE